MRIVRALVVGLAASFSVTGCTWYSAAFNAEAQPTIMPQTETNPTFARDNEGRLIAGPVARFAVSFPPGKRSLITLQNKKQVQVKIGNDYVSASGENCRRVYFEAPNAAHRISAVCQINNVWQTVLPY